MVLKVAIQGGSNDASAVYTGVIQLKVLSRFVADGILKFGRQFT